MKIRPWSRLNIREVRPTISMTKIRGRVRGVGLMITSKIRNFEKYVYNPTRSFFLETGEVQRVWLCQGGSVVWFRQMVVILLNLGIVFLLEVQSTYNLETSSFKPTAISFEIWNSCFTEKFRWRFWRRFKVVERQWSFSRLVESGDCIPAWY